MLAIKRGASFKHDSTVTVSKQITSFPASHATRSYVGHDHAHVISDTRIMVRIQHANMAMLRPKKANIRGNNNKS